MNCNCIKQKEEDTRIRFGAVVASFEHNGGQCSEVCYRPYTAEGKASKHNRYTHIDWAYCPFCGKKIDNKKNKSR